MSSKVKAFRFLEHTWRSILVCGLFIVASGTVTQLTYFLVGDIAHSIAVLNEPWRKATAKHCEQRIEGCQAVTMTQQLFTTHPTGPNWQSVGSRLDVSIVTRPGYESKVKDAFLAYIGSTNASFVSLEVRPSNKGGK